MKYPTLKAISPPSTLLSCLCSLYSRKSSATRRETRGHVRFPGPGHFELGHVSSQILQLSGKDRRPLYGFSRQKGPTPILSARKVWVSISCTRQAIGGSDLKRAFFMLELRGAGEDLHDVDWLGSDSSVRFKGTSCSGILTTRKFQHSSSFRSWAARTEGTWGPRS